MAGKLSFDYSKWDRLELSDDEDTHHPNLDRNLNIRVNRVTRDRKEEDIDNRKKELSAEGKLTDEAEAKLESKRPLHMENMCAVTEERTIINSSAGRVDRITKGREEFSIDEYQGFIKDNKKLIDEFTEADWEKSHAMLNEHGGLLLDDHCNNYFLLTALDAQMKGDTKLVKKLGGQGQIISQIHQLAKPMRRHPRDLVHRFFERFEGGAAQGAFQEGVDHFLGHIERRAIEKKKEDAEAVDAAPEEAAEEEGGEVLPLVEAMYQMKKEERMGPGGLDPVEVFESLPETMQQCFKSGDVELLKKAAEEIDDFETHFKRCVDAGLWRSE